LCRKKSVKDFLTYSKPVRKEFIMCQLKEDWKLYSDGIYNNIRDDSFTIIYSNKGDLPTCKKILRSREMYELAQKLLAAWKAEHPLEPILHDIAILKRNIDSLTG
jgi:hypothetical protein